MKQIFSGFWGRIGEQLSKEYELCKKLLNKRCRVLPQVSVW